mmetsp:Transcript_18195/g.32474  ORF Transcript_18195/g.32474 Transcript_18195/m.32474 type:complete len:478 (+) Transcript_18195:86-1519(+)
MTDATYLLEATALNTMKDEDSAGPPVIRRALDEKTTPNADKFAPPSRADFSDPPFLSDGSQLVCSDPPIWVFDGLLSDSLLERVDNSFNGIKWQSLNGRQVRRVELRVDEQLEELPHVLREISQIEDVAPCNSVWIMDVVGRDQAPHMDGWDLEKNKDMELLDVSKCSVQCHKGFNTIIPTLSFVIYFNNSGGITFPKASLPSPSIPAKRGRIVMFQNYDDLYRPAHNPKAMHYGFYGDTPKRVMTAGVMSSETPLGLSGAQLPGTPRTQGFLYAPIMHTARASCPSTPPTPKPKPVLQLLARSAVGDSFIVEAWSLSGDLVANVILDRAATLGNLKANLGVSAQLVCGDQIIDGADSKPLKDTALLHAFEFGSTKEEIEAEEQLKRVDGRWKRSSGGEITITQIGMYYVINHERVGQSTFPDINGIFHYKGHKGRHLIEEEPGSKLTNVIEWSDGSKWTKVGKAEAEVLVELDVMD